MNTLFTFILGVLSGWLLEWLFDYFFGRRPAREGGMERVRPAAQASRLATSEALPAPLPKPDDLKIIKGIGVVIERKLNEAGIFTFEQLGNLKAEDLQGILGKTIQRLANEDSLLQQARALTRRKE